MLAASVFEIILGAVGSQLLTLTQQFWCVTLYREEFTWNKTQMPVIAGQNSRPQTNSLIVLLIHMFKLAAHIPSVVLGCVFLKKEILFKNKDLQMFNQREARSVTCFIMDIPSPPGTPDGRYCSLLLDRLL